MVWPIAQRQFEETLLGQVHKGLVKYDTTLQSFNGRDAYADLLQEKVDDLMYTTQLYLEARMFVQLTARAVQVVDNAYDTGSLMCFPDEDEMHAMKTWLNEARECLEKSGLSQSQNPSQT